MARHLKLDCNYAISAVYDINQNAAEELASELGSKAYQTLAEVTSLSDVIVTVVTDDAAMRAIYLEGEDTLLQGRMERLSLIAPRFRRAFIAKWRRRSTRREQILWKPVWPRA